MAEFFDRAYKYFVDRGYPPHSAAAMAANAQAESAGDPRAVHDKGTGIGIYGWRDPKPGQGRKTDLINWAHENKRDPYSVQTQLDFADHELTRGSESQIGDRLMKASSYKEAQDLMMGYLRPYGYDPKNPTASDRYDTRWNIGAPTAGATPMPGAPPMGAPQNIAGVGPGGAGVPAITSGLLSPMGEFAQGTVGSQAVPPPTGIDAEIADWSKMGQDPASQQALAKVMAADAAKNAALDRGGDELIALGAKQIAAGVPKQRPPMQFAPMPQNPAYRPQQMQPFPQLGGQPAARMGGGMGGGQMDPRVIAEMQRRLAGRRIG